MVCLCAVLLWWTECNWCVYVQCCCGGQNVTGVSECSAAVEDRMKLVCLNAVLLWWTDFNCCVYVQCCCGGQNVTGVFMCSAAVVDRL